jgi:hypothetical protein
MAGPGEKDFRFPCRFPAKPSINPEWYEQAYDITGFFGMGEVAEKIFPGFSLCGRERKRRSLPPSAQRRGGVATVSTAKARSRHVSSRYSLRRSGDAGF